MTARSPARCTTGSSVSRAARPQGRTRAAPEAFRSGSTRVGSISKPAWQRRHDHRSTPSTNKRKTVMAYLVPSEFVTKMVDAGEAKVFMSTRDTVIRAYIVGAILVPVGFCMLYLFGFDLLTGVFVLAPLALIDRRPGVTIEGVLRNWGLVFVGNFLGAFTVAVMMSCVFTFGWTSPPDKVGVALANIGVARTLGYEEHGAAGMLTLFIRGVLCNWMVSAGVVGAMISTSVSGKVIAMWMPIMLFFYMGFEHSIVNMFLFPSGLLLGGNFSIMDYLIWNEIPTVIGNLVGGLAFVGLALYSTHVRTGAKRNADFRMGAVAYP